MKEGKILINALKNTISDSVYISELDRCFLIMHISALTVSLQLCVNFSSIEILGLFLDALSLKQYGNYSHCTTEATNLETK